MCISIILSLGRNLVLLLIYFPIPGHAKGNQHGGRKYDDLQNWLDMTSHKNPLLRTGREITTIPKSKRCSCPICVFFNLWYRLYSRGGHFGIKARLQWLANELPLVSNSKLWRCFSAQPPKPRFDYIMAREWIESTPPKPFVCINTNLSKKHVDGWYECMQCAGRLLSK